MDIGAADAAVSLALIATPVTAFIGGAVATLLFGFDLREGLLVGAVLASTDGAAIFALLRNSTLRRRLARALEGESGLNDAVAVLLVAADGEVQRLCGVLYRDHLCGAQGADRYRVRHRHGGRNLSTVRGHPGL